MNRSDQLLIKKNARRVNIKGGGHKFGPLLENTHQDFAALIADGSQLFFAYTEVPSLMVSAFSTVLVLWSIRFLLCDSQRTGPWRHWQLPQRCGLLNVFAGGWKASLFDRVFQDLLHEIVSQVIDKNGDEFRVRFGNVFYFFL
jgi:hypothetical protein